MSEPRAMGLGFGVMVGVGVLGVALGLITRRPLVSNNVTDLALWPLELSSGLTAEELMLKLSGGDSSEYRIRWVGCLNALMALKPSTSPLFVSRLSVIWLAISLISS